MKIYHYAAATGYLTSTEDATNIDPLESEKQGHPVYVIPAMATTMVPPSSVPTGKVAYFDYENFPNAWKIKDIPVVHNPDPAPPETPETVIPAISKRQFWQQIGMLNWVERSEALAFMQNGTLPPIMEAAILSLDEQDPTGILQFKARMAFMANEYERDNAFVPMIGQLFGKTSEEIDTLFLSASQAV